MIALHKLGIVMACTIFFEPFGAAQGSAGYRDFEFGMSVASVAEQAQVEPSTARTTYTTPNLIQVLQWNSPGYFSSSAESDPVRSIQFNFYDDQLFKIIATYGRRELQGMTTEDLIEGISRVYGEPSTPNETVVITTSAGYEDRQKILAQWEGSDGIFDLYKSSLGGEFGLVGYSEKLDALVQKVGLEEGVALSGGAVLDEGLVKSLEKKLDVKLLIPPKPRLVTALGASIMAAETNQEEQR